MYTSHVFMERNCARRFACRPHQLLNPTHSLQFREHVTARRIDPCRDAIGNDDLAAMSSGVNKLPLFLLTRPSLNAALHGLLPPEWSLIWAGEKAEGRRPVAREQWGFRGAPLYAAPSGSILL